MIEIIARVCCIIQSTGIRCNEANHLFDMLQMRYQVPKILTETLLMFLNEKI